MTTARDATIPAEAVDRPTCPNCQEPLALPRPAYCPACGQETQPRVPTLADFAKEFGGQLLASEGALWRTLRGLFRPGFLTLAYLSGQRRRYLTPLRLFVSMCLLSAAVAQWVRPSTEPPRSEMLSHLPIKLGEVDGKFVCEHLPAERCAYWERRWHADPELLEDLRRAQQANKQAVRHLVFMVMAPTMAALLQLAYRRRRQPFGVHMVTALHIHCALLPLLMGQVLLNRWLPEAATVTAYLVWAIAVGALALSLQRVYGGRYRITALRLLVVLMGYVFAFGLWAALGITWTLRQTLM